MEATGFSPKVGMRASTGFVGRSAFVFFSTYWSKRNNLLVFFFLADEVRNAILQLVSLVAKNSPPVHTGATPQEARAFPLVPGIA